MKAALLRGPGGPEQFEIAEIPDPVAGPGEVLVRIEAISIEGGDLVARRTAGPFERDHVIGYAAAGTVVALGPAVSGFAVGDRVATFGFTGSHAELRAVPAGQCWEIPPGLDADVAATIPCGPGTAAHALKLAGLEDGAGKTVLITGAGGGVGLAAVQLAARAGARVIGTGTNRSVLDTLRQHGLSDGIVTTGEPASEQVLDLLGGRKVDLLIDNVGGPALSDGLKTLRDGGKAVLIGVFGGWHEPLDAGFVLRRRLSVIGCLLGAVISEPANYRLIADLLKLAEQGQLYTPIDAGFSFSDVVAAHTRAEERGRLGRVVMHIRSER
jgi:NADPH:quinone reductase-like Zn-dependent oxidoreductase